MIPEVPPARGEGQDGGTAKLLPRYEDIVQDGRMQLTALMPGLGAAVWRALLSKIPAIDTFRSQGILPILRRLVAVGEERPVSVNVPIEYTGSFRLAREKGGERLFANMWLEARAPIASTLGPDPRPDAPRELVGRVFAEHVLTRPFASTPAERKVTRLDAPGVPPVPEDEHDFLSAESLIEGAGGPLDDAGDFVFGMIHTDSNQHVNSLVYPRVFEELVARRLMHDARVGAQGLLARTIELRWRRPFFAGERASIGLRVIAPGAGDGWKVGAIGAFSSGGPKPSCAVKLLLA